MAILPSNRFGAPLDSLAVVMSLVCAVHCAVTPLLLALLPMLASTFWVNPDFHFWVLLLVVPMTVTAVVLGFLKHGDRLVLALGILGLLVLTGVVFYEVMLVAPASESGGVAQCAGCAACAGGASAEASGSTGGLGAGGFGFGELPASAMVNMGGAALLIAAHGRNFLLSRACECDSCEKGPSETSQALNSLTSIDKRLSSAQLQPEA